MRHRETTKAVATVSESLWNLYEPLSAATSWLEPEGTTSPVQTHQSLSVGPRHSVGRVNLEGNYELVVRSEEVPFLVRLCAVGHFTTQVEPFRQLEFHGQPAKRDSSNLTIESRIHFDPSPIDFADTLSEEYAAQVASAADLEEFYQIYETAISDTDVSAADLEEFYQIYETAGSDTDIGSDLGWISASSTHRVLSLGDPVKLVDLPRKPPRVSLSDFSGDDD